MPRKKKVSTCSDDEDFTLEEKYNKDDLQIRAPRNAANARERARMRVLSKAFCKLKTTLPWVPADTKLSKLDTLRLAATYIAHLKAVLREDSESYLDSKSLSVTLSWPFAIQNATTPSILVNNSCSVSSSSEVSSPNRPYNNRSHVQSNEYQCYHSENHENMQVNRHSHESAQVYPY
ncbi:musculin [Chelonus insularis]|uniref:musculin n=1 Tax=Chelonus insularis TaxID=460826 RepID=UPI001589B17E|nr:musculin [Chelonus insularis]